MTAINFEYMNLEEDKSNDYFDGPDIPDEPKKERAPKAPKLSPEDPEYWEQPEDEFEHLKPARRKYWKLWLWVAVVAVAIGIIWGTWIRLFSPYVENATQYGYVESIEKRGDVIKTYEGVILPYKSLMDTTRAYDGDFVFSTADSNVAAKLKRMQYANRPVRVNYSVYHTAMPWRGDTKIIITRVDSVRESDILPPDRQPETVKGPAVQ